ncbi:hypothetical protein [Duganella sp. CY15W]|uniref:hypothetical protein n=1 Tax=Duganella sp. CY15W TaxID=2692172 RepID=UPI00136B1D96|nr:hypothetical protein [Duganella sp. CY15W]
MKVFKVLSILAATITLHCQAAVIPANSTLQVNQTLDSDNGNYFLVQQGDGNLVSYRKSDMKPLWATYANGAYTAIQQDGNLVQYNNAGAAVWASNTGGHAANPNFKLGVANNGLVYILDEGNRVIWHNKSIDPSAPTTGIPCQLGGQQIPFGVCRGFPPFRYSSIVYACTLQEALARSAPSTLGMCPPN